MHIAPYLFILFLKSRFPNIGFEGSKAEENFSF